MSLLVLLIPIALIVVFILFKKSSEVAKINEEWMRSAGKLKIAFKKAEGLLDAPRIGGEIDGFPVSVFVTYEKRNANLVPCTVYAVALPEGSTIESVLDKASSRVEAVRTGHPVVDKLLSAGGFDRAKIRALMSDAKDAAIERFSKSCPNVSVDDDRIICKFEGVEADAGLLQERVKNLVRLAKAVSWNGGDFDASTEKAVSAAVDAVKSFVQEKSSAPKPSFIPPLPLAKPPEPEPLVVAAPFPAASSSKPAQATSPAQQEPHGSVLSEKPVFNERTAKPVEAPKPLFEKPAQTSAPQGVETAVDLSSPEPLAKALFSNSFAGQAEKALFEKLKGTQVSWRGVLKSAQEYGMDFNFQGGPGSKAVFELCEISVGSSSLKSKVKAVVQLPKDSAAKLKGSLGQSAGFSGSLMKFEPFAKEIYISGASLQ